ncbi:MAG TPA: sulfotransferase [Thermoanaerobaculia bacterium]|nr:sulfotransferase [Thermoanaerobaculia bacterium]
MGLERAKLSHRPIFIMGMYRSGTSMVAEVVHRWGAYGGDVKLLAKPDSRNPRGFWESDLIHTFSVALFRVKFLSLWHPDFGKELRQRADEPEFRDEAIRITQEMASHNPIWFWKQPYLCLLLPFWKKVLEDITFIITVRNPYESALSWQKFLLPKEEGFDERVSIIAANLLRWQYFMLTALAETEGSRHRVFVDYDRFQANPVGEARRLAGFLDAEYGRTSDEETIEQMGQAVAPDLHRQRASRPFAEVPEATTEQQALDEYLRRKVDDPDLPFVPERYTLFPGWREYLMNIDLFRDYYGMANALLKRPTVRAAVAAEVPFRFLGQAYRGLRLRLAAR